MSPARSLDVRGNEGGGRRKGTSKQEGHGDRGERGLASSLVAGCLLARPADGFAGQLLLRGPPPSVHSTYIQPPANQAGRRAASQPASHPQNGRKAVVNFFSFTNKRLAPTRRCSSTSSPRQQGNESTKPLYYVLCLSVVRPYVPSGFQLASATLCEVKHKLSREMSLICSGWVARRPGGRGAGCLAGRPATHRPSGPCIKHHQPRPLKLQ